MPESLSADMLISHYRIIKKLGTGGMGEVYLAEDSKLDRKVAIKFLSPESTVDQQAKKRLVREARAAAKLDHPNICSIHEVSEEHGRSFIVMQRQLTDHPATDVMADWSPDGKQIVFLSGREGSVQVWVLEVESGRARRLSQRSRSISFEPLFSEPRWSPDGKAIGFIKAIVYTRDNDSGDVYVIQNYR